MQRRGFLNATGLAAGALCLNDPAMQADRDPRAVAVRVRADQDRGEVRPIWASRWAWQQAAARQAGQKNQGR